MGKLIIHNEELVAEIKFCITPDDRKAAIPNDTPDAIIANGSVAIPLPPGRYIVHAIIMPPKNLEGDSKRLEKTICMSSADEQIRFSLHPADHQSVQNEGRGI